MQIKTRSKTLAVISVYAALYAALVGITLGFSYGPIQVRVADTMLAAVPLFGLPGVIGHTLGVLIANAFSPYNPLDLLNVIPSFAMSFVVYYIYKRTRNDYTVIATCIAYSAVLGVTVGLMLSYFIPVPAVLLIAYVAIGNIIATTAIGWPLFKLLKRLGIFERWFPQTSSRTIPAPPLPRQKSEQQ